MENWFQNFAFTNGSTRIAYDEAREFVVLADDMDKGCFVHLTLPLDKSLVTGFD
jgi:hypothetical protein